MMDVAAALQAHFNADELNDELLKIRRALYFDLGVPFPGIQLRFNESCPKKATAFCFQKCRFPKGVCVPDMCWYATPNKTCRR